MSLQFLSINDLAAQGPGEAVPLSQAMNARRVTAYVAFAPGVTDGGLHLGRRRLTRPPEGGTANKEKIMETKQWWKSRTLIGLIVAAVGAFAPKYAPFTELVGPALDMIGQGTTLVGLGVAAFGRVKANTQVTLKKPVEGQ